MGSPRRNLSLRDAVVATLLVYAVVAVPAMASSLELNLRMKFYRNGAQATTLLDGTVLITGGYSGRTAEIWNGNTRTFTAVGRMAYYRQRHTATLLDDGTVLIVGGAGTYPAEIYDPNLQTFSTISYPFVSVGPFASATKLNNGKVLIAGGDASTNKAQIYDPGPKTFTATANDMIFSHSGHSATLLCDGTVLIAGGSYCPNCSGSTGSPNAEIYDPNTNSFSPMNPLDPYAPVMTASRVLHTATRISCSQVLLFGGENGASGSPFASGELYDVNAHTFSHISELDPPAYYLQPAFDHAAFLLDDGDVLFITQNYQPFLRYRPSTKSITVEPLSGSFYPYNYARATAAYPSTGDCGGCPSGMKILVAGGGNLQGNSSTIDAFVWVPTNMSPPPPTLTAITPLFGRTCGGTSLTIDGANFQTGARLSSATTDTVTPTRVTGTTTAQSAGMTTISVFNPDAQYGSIAFEFRAVQSGDANGDGVLDLNSDTRYMCQYLYAGGPPPVN